MTEAPDNPVLIPEFAQLMGVRESTVKHYESQAKKGWPNGRIRPGWPQAKGRILVQVPSPNTPHQPTRSIWSPWWDRAEVEVFLRDFPVKPGRRSQALAER